MFTGRGPGGPKPSAWTRSEGQQLTAFFARQAERHGQRSGGGAAELEWIYTIDGEETHQARVPIGGRVKHLTFGVTGTVLSQGSGFTPGDGSCHAYWMLDGQEVAADVAGAQCLLRGGTGDLEVRLENGSSVWYSARHVAPAPPPPPSPPSRELPAREPPPPTYGDGLLRQPQLPVGGGGALAATAPSPPPSRPSEMERDEPVETLVETPVETRMETPVETPMETPVETPMETQSDEQLRAEMLAAERGKRMAKHTQMRALIAWLVEHRFSGKQSKFCDTIRLAPAELSRYKNGKTCNGAEMLLSDLDARHRWLRGALQKAQLSLEIPVAGAIPTETNAGMGTSCSAAATSAHAISEALPHQSADATVTNAPPKAAFLSVNLREVESAKEGGQVHFVNLGVPVADVRWQMDRPGGGRSLHLRDGLRGRRSLCARRGSVLGGRVFEWWLEPINSRQDLAHHGAPLWVARELNGSISSLGQRIIGRFPSASGGHVGPSSPFLLATAIARHCNIDVRIQGLALTGLIHPAVQELLDAAAESAGLMEQETPAAPASTFGARSGGLGGLKEGGSRLREVGDAAGVAFLQAMESIAPHDPEGVFAQLMKKPSFRTRFLSPEWRDGLSKTAVQEQVLNTPFVATFVKVAFPSPPASGPTPARHQPDTGPTLARHHRPDTVPTPSQHRLSTASAPPRHRLLSHTHPRPRRCTRTSGAFAPSGSCSPSSRRTFRTTSRCVCSASVARLSTLPGCMRASMAARG